MTTANLSTTIAPARRILVTGVIAALLTSVVDVAIALTAVAAGVPQIPALTPGADVTLSVVAGVVGAIGWQVVRRRTADPRRVLSRLVPAVLLLSFIPDVLLGITTEADTGITPILTLALLHVTTISIAAAVYARALPVPALPVEVRNGGRGGVGSLPTPRV